MMTSWRSSQKERERATWEPHCSVDTNPASNTASRPEPELHWNIAAYVNSPCGFFCGSFYLDLSWDFPPKLALMFLTRLVFNMRGIHSSFLLAVFVPFSISISFYLWCCSLRGCYFCTNFGPGHNIVFLLCPLTKMVYFMIETKL